MNRPLRVMISLAGFTALIGGMARPAADAQAGNSQNGAAQQDLRAPATTEWPTPGGDWGNSRHSALVGIDAGNVAKLSGAWFVRFDAATRATPVESNGTIFIPAGPRVYAIDAVTGKTLWSYQPERGTASRSGVAVGEGLVFTGLADGRVVALEEQSGKPVWTQNIQDPTAAKQGGIAGGLVYARGLVLAGLTGESGARGRLVALEAKTGKEAWRFYVIPARGEPGSETWPSDVDPAQFGGGGVWNLPAVDPDLGQVYFGAGNAVPQWGGELREGDNLFNTSVVAVDLKTGARRWHYQLVHHDIWDMDQATPMLLYDAMVDGRPRKALAAMRTDGYLFLLDRETGKPIFPTEERPVKQDLRLKTAKTQPFPVGADRLGPECLDAAIVPKGFATDCWFTPWYYDRPNVASIGISTRAAPMAFNPDTRYFYVMGGIDPWWFRRTPNPYFYFWSKIPTAKQYGIIAAIDSRANKIVWKKQTTWDLSTGSGFLSTAGGLVFRLEPDGTAVAHDAKTGNVLWQFQTGFSGARGGAPITYERNGQQYVVIPAERSLWAFSLNGTITPQPAAPRPPTDQPFGGAIQNVSGDGAEPIRLATVLQRAGEHEQDEYALSPSRARVDAGSTVTWLNAGIEVHTIVAQDGSWTTGPIKPGQTASVKVARAGTYVYTCREHPWTLGELTVR